MTAGDHGQYRVICYSKFMKILSTKLIDDVLRSFYYFCFQILKARPANDLLYGLSVRKKKGKG